MNAAEALATVTIVRPDSAAAPAPLEGAVRSACAIAWRAVELVIAGDALRERLASATPRVRTGVDGLLALAGASRKIASRESALADLQRARASHLLDGPLDMAAVIAGCGRVGDAPAIAAGRRRVRTLALDSLKRSVAAHRDLAEVLADGTVSALLVDTARAAFRHLARTDKDLARWAAPPTGTTTRDGALVAFVELGSSTADLDALLVAVTPPVAEPAAPVAPAIPAAPEPAPPEPTPPEPAPAEPALPEPTPPEPTPPEPAPTEPAPVEPSPPEPAPSTVTESLEAAAPLAPTTSTQTPSRMAIVLVIAVLALAVAWYVLH